MAEGHSSHGTGHDEKHVHVHHLSPTPILIAGAALLTYLGLVFRGPLTVVGILALVGAFLMWVREDAAMWRSRYVDHGVTPGGRDLGWWGMALFLGTEVVLFGVLFGSFFVARDDAPAVWAAARPHLDHALPLVTVNTIILVASGATFHWALHAIRKDQRKQFLIGTVLTLVLGTAFLVIQAREYATLMAEGITLSSSQFGSIFYLLTGTHGFHVFLGLCLIGIVLVRGLMGQFDSERHVAVDTFAIYWHFVDVVWILLYLIVYVGVI